MRSIPLSPSKLSAFSTELSRTLSMRLSAVLIALTLAWPGGVSAVEEEAARETAEAIFAGGCFWCMEPPYDQLDGVEATVSGYTGGDVANPSYEQVTRGGTGHYEAVKVIYDPGQVSYRELIAVFWHNIDPLDDGGQFCDRGSSYRSAIFYRNDKQRQIAEESKEAVAEQFSRPVATEIIAAKEFYPAEDYHQNYYQKNPVRYKYYRYRCGRDQRLEDLWQ